MDALQKFLESDPAPGSYVISSQGGGTPFAMAEVEEQGPPPVHEGLQFGGEAFRHVLNLIRHPATLTTLGR